jgi:hypothetical protein
MKAISAYRRPSVGGFLLVLAVLLARANALAAAAPIYKCFDRNLGVLYTDEPCKGGEQVDIRAGDADPLAVARLQRQRDALDQSADRRIAEGRRAAIERQYAAQFAYPPASELGSYPDEAAYAAYGYGYGVVPYYTRDGGRSKAARPRERIERRHAVPVTPRPAPRM